MRIWNEEHCLNIVLGQERMPKDETYTHAEELSFSALCYGVGRGIQDRVHVFEIRMSD